MSVTHMYGVVLWSDEAECKAVIWCEDHGNLAFYSAVEDAALDGVSLDAGDLIQFDLREDNNIRRARNPQLVVQEHCPGLADNLRSAIPTARPKRPTARRPEGKVISMDAYRRAEPVAARA